MDADLKYELNHIDECVRGMARVVYICIVVWILNFLLLPLALLGADTTNGAIALEGTSGGGFFGPMILSVIMGWLSPVAMLPLVIAARSSKERWTWAALLLLHVIVIFGVYQYVDWWNLLD